MADLTDGTVLGERFHVLGVLGRGGSATVYLAMDGLRRERVALKVVHPHLASDPAVRARLQREVQAATLVQHDAALVPHDLHELDGQLALSMPYHPGQTLAEHVGEQGALPAEEVRALGLRIAGALARAHVAGVLHRDVTANNVLVGEDPADAVLTDFGLARTTRAHTQRSTGLLGTAGYAAPEVYAGERADPRSDLYGLGCSLYLAATGRPAFDAQHPMQALQAQLDESFAPPSQLRPDLPEDLAATIGALLRRDPARRPQGAQDVIDALEGRVAAAAPDAVVDVRRQYLPPGDYTVVVEERDADAARRNRLRTDRAATRDTLEAEILRWGAAMQQMSESVRDWLGVPASPTGASPEQQVVDAVARVAGVQATSLVVPDAALEKRFRLIDATDEATAEQLAEQARTAGFTATVGEVERATTPLDVLARWFWVPIAVGWATFPFAASLVGGGEFMVPTMIALSIILPVFASARQRGRPDLDGLRVAFRATLAGSLQGDAPAPRYAVEAVASESSGRTPAPAAVRRGSRLRTRAEAALDALDEAIAESPGLPEAAAIDLRGTSRELRRAAETLGGDVDRLEGALQDSGAPEAEVARVQARLDRLRTKQRAGEDVQLVEIARLERAIDEHGADLRAAEQVEAHLTASSARLMEIASTASRVRRELVAAPEPGRSADALVDKLRRQQRDLDAARREASVRAAAATRRERG